MSAREPKVGEFVRLGDGSGSIVTGLLGPTWREPQFRDSFTAGDYAVTVGHRGDRIVYVSLESGGDDEYDPAGWAAGGEDFQDRDPYRAAIARAEGGAR